MALDEALLKMIETESEKIELKLKKKNDIVQLSDGASTDDEQVEDDVDSSRGPCDREGSTNSFQQQYTPLDVSMGKQHVCETVVLVGQYVLKELKEDLVFIGKIENYDNGLYRVDYETGDVEDLNSSELRDILLGDDNFDEEMIERKMALDEAHLKKNKSDRKKTELELKKKNDINPLSDGASTDGGQVEDDADSSRGPCDREGGTVSFQQQYTPLDVSMGKQHVSETVAYVGRYVLKELKEDLVFIGKIENYDNGLYRVDYETGDVEDLNSSELWDIVLGDDDFDEELIERKMALDEALLKKIVTERKKTELELKKKNDSNQLSDGASTDDEQVEDDADSSRGPCDREGGIVSFQQQYTPLDVSMGKQHVSKTVAYVGRYVLKELKEDLVFIGKIENYDNGMYRVDYETGDVEDLNSSELRDILLGDDDFDEELIERKIALDEALLKKIVTGRKKTELELKKKNDSNQLSDGASTDDEQVEDDADSSRGPCDREGGIVSFQQQDTPLDVSIGKQHFSETVAYVGRYVLKELKEDLVFIGKIENYDNGMYRVDYETRDVEDLNSSELRDILLGDDDFDEELIERKIALDEALLKKIVTERKKTELELKKKNDSNQLSDGASTDDEQVENDADSSRGPCDREGGIVSFQQQDTPLDVSIGKQHFSETVAYVGRYVLKELEEDLVYVGKIENYDNGLYRVDYETGDVEDLNSSELRDILLGDDDFDEELIERKMALDEALIKKIVTERKKTELELKKKNDSNQLSDGASTDDEQVEDDADSSRGPCDREGGIVYFQQQYTPLDVSIGKQHFSETVAYVGRYVLKELKEDLVFIGKIENYDNGLYRVDYETGDVEDLNSSELRDILLGDDDFDEELIERKIALDEALLKKIVTGRKKTELELKKKNDSNQLSDGASDGEEVEDDADSSKDPCDREGNTNSYQQQDPPLDVSMDLNNSEFRDIVLRDDDFVEELNERNKALDEDALKQIEAPFDVSLSKQASQKVITIPRGPITRFRSKKLEDALAKTLEVSASPLVLPLQLPPSSGTIGVVENYVSHLFSVYTFLRSFSIQLFLHPFGLDEFVGSLNYPVANTLFDSIHVALLRALKRHLDTLSTEFADNCLKCGDWTLLDNLTWPDYLVQYLTVKGDIKGREWQGFYDNINVMEYYALTVSSKLMLLQILCNDVLEYDVLKAEIDRRHKLEIGAVPDDAVINLVENRPKRIRRKKSTNFTHRKKKATEILSKSQSATSNTSAFNDGAKNANVGEEGNSDECRLCGLDGMLLCCDECSSTYHSRCIGVGKMRIPNEPWYCPECTICKLEQPIMPETSLKRKKTFGVDAYGQVFLGTCNHLLVLKKASANIGACLRYYNSNDIPKVLKTISSSVQDTSMYSGIFEAIKQHWNIPAETDTEIISSTSSITPQENHSGFSRSDGSSFKPNAYMNHYFQGDFASSAAEVWETVKEADKLSNGLVSEAANVSLQAHAFWLHASRFFWPTSKKKLMDVPRERCEWCFTCKSTASSTRRAACLLNSAASTVVKSSMKIIDGLKVESGEGSIASIARYMLYLAEMLSGLVAGPFLGAAHKKEWRKRVKEATTCNTLKVLLLEFEENIRSISLSEEWVKATDDWFPKFSIFQTSTQKRAPTLKRRKNQSRKDKIFPWYRGEKVSALVFQKAILSFSIVRNAGHQGGVKTISGIEYGENSEIPKRSRQLVWRAAVERSTTSSQLALQVRYLDLHVRWRDLFRADQNSQDDINSEFKNAKICDKKVVDNSTTYRITFGNQKQLSSHVMENVIEIQQNEDGNNKYWFLETLVPLYLIKKYETSVNKKHSSESSDVQRLKQPKASRGDIFSYLASKIGLTEEKCSSTTCENDVLSRGTLECSACHGYCHSECALTSMDVVCKKCHSSGFDDRYVISTTSPGSPLPMPGPEYHSTGAVTVDPQLESPNPAEHEQENGKKRKLDDEENISGTEHENVGMELDSITIFRPVEQVEENISGARHGTDGVELDPVTDSRFTEQVDENISGTGHENFGMELDSITISRSVEQVQENISGTGHENFGIESDSIKISQPVEQVEENVSGTGHGNVGTESDWITISPFVEQVQEDISGTRHEDVGIESDLSTISQPFEQVEENVSGTEHGDDGMELDPVTISRLLEQLEESMFGTEQMNAGMESDSVTISQPVEQVEEDISGTGHGIDGFELDPVTVSQLIEQETENNSGTGLRKLPVRRPEKTEEKTDGPSRNFQPEEPCAINEMDDPLNFAGEISLPSAQWNVSASNAPEDGMTFNEDYRLEDFDFDFEPQTYFSLTDLLDFDEDGNFENMPTAVPTGEVSNQLGTLSLIDQPVGPAVPENSTHGGRQIDGTGNGDNIHNTVPESGVMEQEEAATSSNVDLSVWYEDPPENLAGYVVKCALCLHEYPPPDLCCRSCRHTIHYYCSQWVEPATQDKENWLCGQCRRNR